MDFKTGPSDTYDYLSESEVSAVKAVWSPYVGVFPDWENTQQPHLLKLINAGMLKGVRLGDLGNPTVQYFARWLQSHGVEVLGLFDNEHLRRPDVCQILSQYITQNPGITIWEIANEVQGFANMSSEEYMRIATPLFYYAKQNHPNIRLAIGAVAGNGSSADDLRRMIDAGLDKLCRDGLEIVPIHFYSWESTRLHEFKSQIERLPISTRIWITETNHMPPSWTRHIGYVKEIYPMLKNSLRAERIYWYVFSEGRDFCGGEYSLVKGLWNDPPIEYSPLMKLLIGMIDDSLNSNTSSDDSYSGLMPLNFPRYQPPVSIKRYPKKYSDEPDKKRKKENGRQK